MNASSLKIACGFGAGLFVGMMVTESVARAAPSPTADEAGTGRVTGIGGIFFKAKDPDALQRWYVEHLGFPAPRYNVNFEWRQKGGSHQPGSTTWATFPDSTRYFDPTAASFMINYRVSNLDALVTHLRSIGVHVDDAIVEDVNGRFTHAVDPEGNRFELWEPSPGN